MSHGSIGQVIPRAGPATTSVVLVFGPHILEAPGHPEMLSLSSPQLAGAGRLVFVGLLLIPTCAEAHGFRWVILLPLIASLQSGESTACLGTVRWTRAQPGRLSFTVTSLAHSLPYSVGHSVLVSVGPVRCWEQRPGNSLGFFPAESSLPRQGEWVSLVLLYSCGN